MKIAYSANPNFCDDIFVGIKDETRHLLQKYNVPTPRYTSYPTVPNWALAPPDASVWRTIVKDAGIRANASGGAALYIHLPYCESLCTYCGCNTRITKNHSVESSYILSVLKEWALYLDALEAPPALSEVHLGGGTPTFFSPENLEILMDGLLSSSYVTADCQLSIEAHPSSTTAKHLDALANIGFRRISYGIQDFSRVVQKAINRFQEFEDIALKVKNTRRAGFTSVNFDLVYGLPFQTFESLKDTIKKVIDLKPDRIAFYSYAHIPWKKPAQRGYSEADLPPMEEKFRLFLLGQKMLLKAGYQQLGMDHFALPDDELTKAATAGRLERNFMGYTTPKHSLLIGLGASSISDAGLGYAQNISNVEQYKAAIEIGNLPLQKGHWLTPEEVKIRGWINDLMCNFSTS